MSAGRGVLHSEYNPSTDDDVHFLQIWIEPSQRGIAPGYEQAHVDDEAKRGRLALIAGPAGSGAAVTIHQDARVYAALVDGDERIRHDVAAGRHAYVHVVRGRARCRARRRRRGGDRKRRSNRDLERRSRRNPRVRP
jgi:redox-sensitive bicupin YhaK (pirin superfamily)